MAVHLDHVEQTLFFNRGKFAVLAETGVVDQQIDLQALFFCESKNVFRSVRIGQVRGKYFRGDL